MKYCKKCGAEIPEGAGFCEKCGNPVGKTPEQENSKKRWILAIGSGVVIILATVTVGVLYVTGILGGKKDEAVQVDADRVASTETPNVSGGAVKGAEESEGAEQEDTSGSGNTEDMAWEAFQAYKILIDGDRDGWEEEMLGSSYDSSHYFSLIYLDSDNYPELLVHQTAVRPADGNIYTYKGSDAEEVSFFAGGTIAYQEKMGYIYSRGWYTCDWTECMNLYNGDSASSLFNNTISDENDYYGVEEVARLVGVDNGREWITLDHDNSSEGSDIVWGENIDEAYIQLLNRNKSNYDGG